MLKLDKIDKKLLIVLDTDATLAISALAKKLNVSREVVAYRMKQLEQKGVILKYITLANFTKIGDTHFKTYIKFSKITKEVREEIISYLASFPKLGWLASTEGIFDLMFSLRYKNKYLFEEFKDTFFQKYDQYFQEAKFAMLTEAETKPRYYILDTLPKTMHIFYHVNNTDEKRLDEIDHKVLSAISLDARAPYHELAKNCKTTPRVVRYRRTEMIKSKVIVGSKLMINYRKLNYLFFKCFVVLRNINSPRYALFKSYIRNHPNMIYWIKVIGSWDLELEIEVPSIGDFYKVVEDMKERFPDIINSFDASLVSKEHAIMHV